MFTIRPKEIHSEIFRPEPLLKICLTTGPALFVVSEKKNTWQWNDEFRIFIVFESYKNLIYGKEYKRNTDRKKSFEVICR